MAVATRAHPSFGMTKTLSLFSRGVHQMTFCGLILQVEAQVLVSDHPGVSPRAPAVEGYLLYLAIPEVHPRAVEDPQTVADDPQTVADDPQTVVDDPQTVDDLRLADSPHIPANPPEGAYQVWT